MRHYVEDYLILLLLRSCELFWSTSLLVVKCPDSLLTCKSWWSSSLLVLTVSGNICCTSLDKSFVFVRVTWSSVTGSWYTLAWSLSQIPRRHSKWTTMCNMNPRASVDWLTCVMQKKIDRRMIRKSLLIWQKKHYQKSLKLKHASFKPKWSKKKHTQAKGELEQQRQPQQNKTRSAFSCLHCGKAGHMIVESRSKQVGKPKTKEGTIFVCSESNSIDIPSDSWRLILESQYTSVVRVWGRVENQGQASNYY